MKVMQPLHPISRHLIALLSIIGLFVQIAAALLLLPPILFVVGLRAVLRSVRRLA